MLFYAITGLINSIGTVFLGLLVYLKNKKDNVNKTFGLLCLSIVLWSFPYYFWQNSQTSSVALFWSRFLMVGAILIPVTYLHFIFTLLGLEKRNKSFLIASYILAFIFLVFDFTPLFVRGVKPELYFSFWPQPGIFFHPFLFMFISYIAYGCYLLFRAYKKNVGIERIRISYFLIASLIGFPSGATNYFLWYGIPTPPYWNIFVILFPILTTIGITRHYLFDIRVILTEVLVIATGLTLLIQAWTAEVFLLKILGTLLFFLFAIFGYQLVRSVIREIQLRGALELAYGELKKLDDAKSEFISIASHQLRTPLTAVKGYVSMILENSYGEIPKTMDQPLKNVYASNERLIGLVNDILNISKIEAGKMEMDLENTSLEELILDIINELRIKADAKKLYLTYVKPRVAIPLLMIDKTKIRQAILNFIDNSIKYTEKGGTTVKLLSIGPKIRIEISDTGMGITKEDLPRLFESFSRGRNGSVGRPEGTGLGLYIARRFVEMHKGKVWAESEGKGKGSAFFIELPVK